MNILGDWYNITQTELVAFGPAWCGPAKLKHGEETLIARYVPEPDGQPVEIYCAAMPARFYHIRALAWLNSCGEPISAFELRTGAGFDSDFLAAKIAHQTARGMLAFHQGNIS